MRVAHAPGMPETFSPPPTSKKTAIPACITARASRTCRDACRDCLRAIVGKAFPAFPAHVQPAILRIWQEVHCMYILINWVYHWGQPRKATVVKMAPTRPLASRSFCLLAPLCDHRSLSNLLQSSTRAMYTLYQNGRLVPFLVYISCNLLQLTPPLTHSGRVTHIWVNKLSNHWFR